MLDKLKQQHFGELVAASSFEELIWMNGFLSGALTHHKGGSALVQPAVQPSASSNAPLQLTIAYGTETGNAKSLAGKLSAQAKKLGTIVKTVSLDQYRIADLSKAQTLILIVSTQGDGEPPAAAQKFFDYINSNDVQLPQLRYGVIGLGDSAYPQFCQAGKDLDRRLSELGAARITAAQLCDTDYEEASVGWFRVLLESLSAANIVGLPNIKASVAYTNSAQKRHYTGKILRNINLNDRGSEKQTHHIEIAAEGVTYLPGDSLGVVPLNPKPIMEAIVRLCGAQPDTPVTFRNETLALSTLLQQKVNITCLPPRTVKRYAAIVGQEIPEVKIGLADLLSIYPVKDFAQFKEVLDALEPITPRLYSISSSPTAHEGEVHITVKRDEFYLEEEKRYGVCSDYLSELPVDTELSFYIHPNNRFRLPSPESDLIMIGAGTGIAPFRSFLAERGAQGATGRAWLFFGDQRFGSDFLYQTEWQSHLESGVLTKINTAFSRDQKEKIYVQHKLREHGAAVYEWLQGGASIYVCGAREPMSVDVEAAILDIISEYGNKSTEATQSYLQDLEESGRYMKDVY